MTVDFRTAVLSKGNHPEQARESHDSQRSPAAFLMAVVLAVASGLCAVAWIFG
ncbi:MAG TPA: hypothetical protein VI282_13410 [Verrucomicrobiae bacterium]|jgi:hypothetical protein